MSELAIYSIIVVAIAAQVALYLKLRSRVRSLNKLVGELLVRPASLDRRVRKRYVVFSIVSSEELDKHLVERAIRGQYRKYFGELHLVKADPQLIYFDQKLQRGVVRVTHAYVESLIAVLSLIREVNSHKCLFIPLKTTGTIKRARRALYALHLSANK